MESPIKTEYSRVKDLKDAEEIFHPGFSVDCVLFGFHENRLKVLLVNRKSSFDKWGLPGGGMRKVETAEQAAIRSLQFRTGLENIFLRQFQLFSDLDRTDLVRNRSILEHQGIENIENHWFMQRFITLGFYALIKYEDYTLFSPALKEDEVQWFEIEKLPEMILDHRKIFDKALETLRRQINFEPIGYNLLPEKFTMPDLQKLYETILGVQLERSNFKRKMLAYDILINTYEQRMGGKHKAPFLYKFDVEKYQQALQKGLQRDW